ncbi:MAG: DEAD/DEAH box helicase [Chlorobi bacterium]|nr:DEAD/DEAH box helicase [Chlorobiota bacterium]
MNDFDNLNISRQLLNAISDLGFGKLTPIQEEVFSPIRSGKDLVGIAQTGTGKTLAYMLPLLHDLKFSSQISPRILILAPTRELVIQLVRQIESYTKYLSIRTLGVYGGTNINTQKQSVVKGVDILVATPGRLYDLGVSAVLQLKTIKKLIIDEVDVMLDLGFRHQLKNIFELLPERRQNLMFSATMTEDVDELINTYFQTPAKISIALSGTPLENIEQQCYRVENFFTKANLLKYLLSDKKMFSKTLVFVSSKKNADLLLETLDEDLGKEISIIHSNKAQNYRNRSIRQFEEGQKRILIATDVIARGMDITDIKYVISFDTPMFAENYLHRIGRTGRAEKQGHSILFYTENETQRKNAIELLMEYRIPEIRFPAAVEISEELSPDEKPKPDELVLPPMTKIPKDKGDAYHDKLDKNKKTNQGGSYLFKKKKYKNPQTRGDKNMNKRSKKRRR